MHRRSFVVGGLTTPACPALVVSILSVFAVTGRALAVDDEAAFVDALRQRGEHALVIEYLDGAAGRGLTSDAFRRRLGYERLVTRLDQVRTIRGLDKRRAALEDASASLEGFVAETADKRLAAEGQARLAEALVSLALPSIAAAQPIGDEATPQVEEARALLEQACDLYTSAQQAYQAELDRFQGVSADSPQGQERLLLRDRVLQTRLRGAWTLQQQARAYQEGGRRSKKQYAQAAKLLADYYEENSKSLYGLYAHLYEGQCYLALGQTKLAAGCFELLIELEEENEPLRQLITLGHASLVETRLADGKAELALRDGEAWYERLPGREEADPAGLALAYQLATTAAQMAGEEGADSRRLLGQARRWYRAASRTPNEYRDRARDGLSRVNDALGASGGSLGSFADAYQAVRDAISSLAASKQAVKIAERNNPAVVVELEEDISGYRRSALVAIDAALSLVEDGTPAVQLNEVRSNQAFLLWESGDYLRAAVVGEFLTTQYPDDPSAEQAASLALASLQRLYQQAREAGGDGRFEVARLERLTGLVTKNLPGSRAASGAAGVLVSIQLNAGRIDEARRVLGLVPEASRAALELQLANSVWERAIRKLAEADEAARPDAERQKTEATAMLVDAFNGGRGKPVTAPMATAALYLAQASLDRDEPGAALAALEDKELGPLTLLAARSPATARGGYAAEVYKLAMRCYLTLDPPRTDDALRVMKRLEAAVAADGGDAAAQRSKLTRVYFNLGVQLQRQMAELADRGEKKQARQLGAAVAAFLDSLAEQAADAGWTTRQWIGRTYLQLADDLESDDVRAAKAYRSQARDVFQGMIDRAAEDPAFPPKESSLLAARLQLGRALSKLGEHEQAVNILCEILKQRGALLEVQKATAYALQEWGASADARKLEEAIRGARLDPKTRKNLVWGWSRLSRVAGQAARSRPQYKDLFFEAWVNIVTCRVIAAQKASGSQREKQLASAKRSLTSMARNYKDLGGPVRRKEFDQLAKRVQRLEGKEPVGIGAYEK